MFRTQYLKHDRVHVPLGSRVKTLFSPSFDSVGRLSLVESGEANLYAEIQSHRDSVDINVLLSRYRNGDSDALTAVQGFYGDFTKAPTSFADALNCVIAARQYFDSLPVEARANFGHDFNRFVASMDSPTFYSDIGLSQPVSQLASVFNESSAEIDAVPQAAVNSAEPNAGAS